MKQRFHPEMSAVTIDMLMHALSEPVRLNILLILDKRGLTACADVYAALGIGKTNASHHFRILRENGLIRATMIGRDLHTQIRHQELEAKFPGLVGMVLGAWREDRAPEAGA
ncbi:winged helix-turn-helix domain-containing protein [Pluralibacter gergoviae]|uniref:ArsR/SmtB family transcription factor n=1 Tax=Pluralibacter gergoviae TaxID=61647 RepID=UPI002EDB05A4